VRRPGIRSILRRTGGLFEILFPVIFATVIRREFSRGIRDYPRKFFANNVQMSFTNFTTGQSHSFGGT